jgi:hypothetical protein
LCEPTQSPTTQFFIPHPLPAPPQNTKTQIEAAKAAAVPIAVKLNGADVPGVAGVSSPMDIAKAADPALAKTAVVAKVCLCVDGWMDGWRWMEKSLSLSLKHTLTLTNPSHPIPTLQVNGSDWDLLRPLEADCELQLFSFDTKEGEHVSRFFLFLYFFS